MQNSTGVTETHLNNHQTFAHGMEIYSIEDGKITVVVHGGNMTREATDTAFEVVTLAVNTYSEPQSAYVLYDISRLQGITPYMRQNSPQMLKNFDANRQVYMGVIGSGSMVNTLVRLIVNQMVRFFSNRIHIKLIDKRDDAIKWLLQKYKSS